MRDENKKGHAVLIPSYDPDEELITLCERLVERGMTVVVVNDGSAKGKDVFERLAGKTFVTMLVHDKNRGKGAALKTGLDYIWKSGCDTVVTADSDGQHSAEDISRISELLQDDENKDRLLTGARSVELMPPKSKTGNSITRVMFKALYGIDLTDTQTGLRGFRLTEERTAALLDIGYDRYEYEMEMLVRSRDIFPGGIREVPIETIYINNNAETHFRPLADGARIYKVLFRSMPLFLISSLLAFAIDYGAFNIFYYSIFREAVRATVSARVISATFNYIFNRKAVFKNAGSKYTFANYVKLAAAILVVNSLIMALLVNVMGLPAFLMKIIVECVLYTVSFTVQNNMSSRR